MSEVRILVVDDYLPWHKSVVSILRQSPAMRVVGTAVNGLEALTRLIELRPDVVLLDFDMPVLDGIQTMAEILRLSPSTRVIFVTASDSPTFREQAFEAGAVGVVSKMHAGFRLISAIRESLEQ
ncbi:MAG TPA: response regulator transcription factor [Candidatus Angelobacter sp.]|nr:response regulator transcription factor [Candidatus Angelobacter sp.]